MKKLSVSVLFIFFVFFPLITVWAAPNSVNIPSEQAIDGPGFYSGEEIIINGSINGDLFLAGNNIQVNGPVKGDILAVGRSITLNGPVEGDVRLAGQHIYLQNDINKSATVAAQNIWINTQCSIGQELIATGENIDLNGKIGRNLYAGCASIIMTGMVNSNARIYASEEIRLHAPATITGNLQYHSPEQAIIDPGVTIQGEQNWQKTDKETKTSQPGNHTFSFFISLIGYILFWLLINWLKKDSWSWLSRPLQNKLPASLGIGTLFLFCTPIIFIILLISLVGIPIALTVITVYGLLLYGSKLVAAQFLAEILKNKINYSGHILGLLLMCLLLLMIATRLPYIGWFVSLLTVVSGSGSIIMTLWQARINK